MNYQQWLIDNQLSIESDICTHALNWLNQQASADNHDTINALSCNTDDFIKLSVNGKTANSKAGYKATKTIQRNKPVLNVLYNHFKNGKSTYQSTTRVKELWEAFKLNKQPLQAENPITQTIPISTSKTTKSTVTSDLTKFDKLPVTGISEYLNRKQIAVKLPIELRFSNDKLGKYIALLVTDIEGNKRGLQRIYDNGDKRFSTGLKKRGGFIAIGDYTTAPNIAICEGFATGASIHLATGYAVLCALDAGNLGNVAINLKSWLTTRGKHAVNVVVCADNDINNSENVGLNKALNVCQNTGFKLAYPKSNSGTDFNDLHIESGLEAIKPYIDNATVENIATNLLLNDGELLAMGKSALVILAKSGFSLGYDKVLEKFRVYKSGKWEIVKDIAHLLIDWINAHTNGGEFSKSWLDGTLSVLSKNCIKDFSTQLNNHLIPFKNGVFNINTKTLLSHSPDYLLTWQIPHDYSASADCPKFKKFLFESVKHNDVVQVLRAYINAVIFGRSYLQRYLELIGAGGSGKSTFGDVVIGLIGIENHKSTSFHTLEEDKFEVAKLVDKRLAYFADQNSFAKSVEMFKRLTGKDTLPIRLMHKQDNPDCVFNGMVIVTGNEPIKTTDNSSGLHRRRILIRFDNQPVRNEHLRDELIAESSGIVNWVMELTSDEVKYLTSQNNASEIMQMQSMDNLKAVNPLAEFFADNTQNCVNAMVQVGVLNKQVVTTENELGERITYTKYLNQDIHLYPAYVVWCESTGRKPVAHNTFTNQAVDVLKNILKWEGVEKRKTNKGAQIHGVKLVMASDELYIKSDGLVTDKIVVGDELNENDGLSSNYYTRDNENVIYPEFSNSPIGVIPKSPSSPSLDNNQQVRPSLTITSHHLPVTRPIKLYPSDLKFWEKQTANLNHAEKVELASEYDKQYQSGYDNEESVLKKSNIGRQVANTWLRENVGKYRKV
ncbi:putative ATPase [Beggiatoa alba B18LD]|uniref:Putative ATPase n=1 Tax=Beggiatoa alba B18LD TaxID=395493 RepID=I3CBD5_9GAMM|nr:phage/plasmid primase, P4 family [Beggiatoa alba]EIJ40928.1 putative ATPase [Beggiatoa alba B18LD]